MLLTFANDTTTHIRNSFIKIVFEPNNHRHSVSLEFIWDAKFT